MVPKPRGTQCEHSDEIRGGWAARRHSTLKGGMAMYLRPRWTAQNDATRSSWRGHHARPVTVAVRQRRSFCRKERSEVIVWVSPTRRAFGPPQPDGQARWTPRHRQRAAVDRGRDILGRGRHPCTHQRAGSRRASPRTRFDRVLSRLSGLNGYFQCMFSSRDLQVSLRVPQRTEGRGHG